MAGIVGNNLNSYMEQQLEEIDLFYLPEGMPKNVWRSLAESMRGQLTFKGKCRDL